MIERFTRNTRGRDVIVGDIHGYFSRLQAALDWAKFDPTVDRLFSVGDLVDRGPESAEVLDWLAKPWVHAVSGNHEAFAIEWQAGNLLPQHYRQNGGTWNMVNPDAWRIASAFRELPLAIELETAGGLIGIVHADCPFDDWAQFRKALEMGGEAAESAALLAHWSRDRIETQDRTVVKGVRAVVVGHNGVDMPGVLGNVYFIDTGPWRGGPFTLLDAASLRAAQAPMVLSEG